MPYTLAQLAQVETTPLRKGVIMNLLRYSQLFEVIPWETVTSLTSLAKRVRDLPGGITWRQINQGYTEDTTGQLEDVWESVYIMGGEVRFDRIFDYVKNVIQDPKQLQLDLKLKRLALDFNDIFINGDHAVDPDAPEGLRKRVDGMPAEQSVYFAGVAGDGTAALDPTASAANANVFFSKLEEMFYMCEPKPSAFFVNRGMIYGLGRVARYVNFSGGFAMDVTKDSFERTIPTYGGVPFYDVGLLADQTTEVITDTETANDAGADATSLYAVSFGGPEGFTGIQLHELMSYDPLGGSEQEATPTKLVRIEWPIGFSNFGSRCIVRGRNVEGATQW